MQNTASKDTKIAYIDSLRGIAILMVIAIHVSQSVQGLSPAMQFISSYGQMGVQLFFVLSAFTLCLSVERRVSEADWLKKFYIRRYFRIAPLYYIGIFLYFTINCFSENHFGKTIMSHSEYSLTNIIANLFFVHSFYTKAIGVVPGGWSISVEFIFYMLFPVFILLYRTFLNKSVYYLIAFPIVSFGVCSLAINLYVANVKDVNPIFLYTSLVNQLSVFFIGMSFYFYQKKYVDNGLSNTARKKILFGFFYVLTFCLSLFVFYKQYNTTLVPFIGAISFVYLILFFKYVQNINIAILRKIGQLSFSMYITHFLFAWTFTKLVNKIAVKHSVNPTLTFIGSYVICFILTFIVSYFSEKYIESPGIKRGNLIIRRMDSMKLKSTEKSLV